MPAAFARSEYRGASFMRTCSHITNISASPQIRISGKDASLRIRNNSHMARRGIPKGPVNWFLQEWMASRGLDGRGSQTKMMELTGWSRATMSQLYNGQQDYSPVILKTAAEALNAEPFELLMPPERAMAIRRALASAREIASLAYESPAEPLDGTRN